MLWGEGVCMKTININPSSLIADMKFAKKKGYISAQQLSTLKGQVRSGDINGAYKGLKRLTKI